MQKDSFLYAEKSVDFGMHFRKKLFSGLFGGEGFILQKLSGPGLAFVNFDGDIVEKALAPGELLRADTGHIAMFEPTVEFDVEVMSGFTDLCWAARGYSWRHYAVLVASGCSDVRDEQAGAEDRPIYPTGGR